MAEKKIDAADTVREAMVEQVFGEGLGQLENPTRGRVARFLAAMLVQRPETEMSRTAFEEALVDPDEETPPNSTTLSLRTGEAVGAAEFLREGLIHREGAGRWMRYRVDRRVAMELFGDDALHAALSDSVGRARRRLKDVALPASVTFLGRTLRVPEGDAGQGEEMGVLDEIGSAARRPRTGSRQRRTVRDTHLEDLEDRIAHGMLEDEISQRSAQQRRGGYGRPAVESLFKDEIPDYLLRPARHPGQPWERD